jgi:hypothetical protein
MSQQPPQGPPPPYAPPPYGPPPYGPPPPGWQLPPRRPKRKWYTRWWVWEVLIVMGLAFAGCTAAMMSTTGSIDTASPPATQAPAVDPTIPTPAGESAAEPTTGPPTTKAKAESASCRGQDG